MPPRIAERDIREVGAEATIIEEHPDDRYPPSCLLLGFTRPVRPFTYRYRPLGLESIPRMSQIRMNGLTIRQEAEMFVCAVCGADDGREELVEQVFNIEGRRLLVEGVPCMVCARCGGQSFRWVSSNLAKTHRLGWR